MRFLPFIKGQDFLIIYGIFAVVVLIVIRRLLHNSDKKDFIISGLDEDKYYVLNNKYNLHGMFYYITYKLYAKGLLVKDEEDKKFQINKELSSFLTPIEENVYILYLDKFAPKDFEPDMVNEKEFKTHYDRIYNKLVLDGLIKDDVIIRESKSVSNLGMVVVLVPGIWRLVGGIAYGMPVGALVFEIILIFIISKIVLHIHLNDKLTRCGKASKEAFEKYYKSSKGNTNKINENNPDVAQDFLMTSSWMYFLGVSSIYTKENNNSFNNNSGSSCSSCSSCSGSSCSSCSSCGGCGGN
ncbi:hypothetical protein [Clostridium chromiireducens]|uniref:TIGR04222 domain-containing membrane protein n=1 Tax=Clostridium chromiireducens TaxID=225345 RepID=A0A1V4IHL0_9CLOT|nr:hypothetical protein [Clostridium chromiireducens]OPJ59304.1 hypothetical protein CLCHR_35380 [Clostridium chromiireducens]RII33403.1 hypothetical protein D2A34_16785 [Clostridium chromiireducens]